MARWITFDSASAERMKEYRPDDAVLVQSGTALQAALEDPSDSVVVMPGPNEQTVLLLRLHKELRAADEPRYQATGFLGLMDEPVYDDEEPADEKKRWWKKVF